MVVNNASNWSVAKKTLGTPVCHAENGYFGDIQLDESRFGFCECIRMRTCKRVHDKLSCTCLQNYPIVYTNMVAVTKFVAKSNITTMSASKTMWHFGNLMHNYAIICSKWTSPRTLKLTLQASTANTSYDVIVTENQVRITSILL